MIVCSMGLRQLRLQRPGFEREREREEKVEELPLSLQEPCTCPGLLTFILIQVHVIDEKRNDNDQFINRLSPALPNPAFHTP